MRDLHEVRAVLRPLHQARPELLQRDLPEPKHLIAGPALRRILPKRLQHIPQRDAERDAADELVLDERPEEPPSDLQLPLGVLVEEAVLVKEVVDHAAEYLLLLHVPAALEALQQGDDLRDAHVARVDLLEVGVGDVLGLLSHFARNSTCWGTSSWGTSRSLLLLLLLLLRFFCGASRWLWRLLRRGRSRRKLLLLHQLLLLLLL